MNKTDFSLVNLQMLLNDYTLSTWNILWEYGGKRNGHYHRRNKS